MVVYNNVLAGASGSGSDSYKIERSLRFNSADSAYLNRTPSSAGDRKTWTWSGWVKRTAMGADKFIFSAGSDPANMHYLRFKSNDTLEATEKIGDSVQSSLVTTAVYRDPSAWYHIIYVYDSMQATTADRLSLYVNGAKVTAFGTSTYPSQYHNPYINSTSNHFINARPNPAGYSDAYLAEIHFVDGQALAATDFGEYDNDGVWQPKDCKDDLTYGSNGFYLSFNDTSSNSALGLDKRPGATQDPTATTYGSITGGSVANVFDGVLGHTSELQLRPNGAGVTLDTAVTASTSVRIYGSSEGTANARYQINGSNTSAVPLTYPSRGWTTISGLSFPITINSFGIGGGSSNDGARLSAIEIDGTVLTGTANNWTVSNISAADGAAVTVSSAGGALPIRNTTGDQGGTAASGFRTDANASNLYLALPLNTNTSDVSNSINSNSTTKSTTNYSTATSSTQSRFYGNSSQWNANSDGILVAESGSELVFGTGDYTIECWLYDDNSHNGGGNGRCYIFDNRIGGSVVGDPPMLLGHIDSHNEFNFYDGSNEIKYTVSSTIGKWYHYAVSREGTTTRMFIDGVLRGTATSSTNFTNNGIGIGRATDGGYGFAGYIQDFRIYKTAKYTSNFSVPTFHDTSVGAACDSLIDSPTDYEADSGNNGGNYCTLNVLDKRSTVTLSNGNLDATTSTSHWSGVKGTIGVSSGKYYYEVTYGDGNAGRIFVGICGHDVDIDPNSYVQDDTTERAKGMLLFCDDGRYQLDTASRVNMTSQPVTGDVIGVAFDLDNNTAQFYKNGAALGSIDISGSTLASTTVVPIVVVYQSGVNHNFNAGQRPFAYPVSGYSTLCTTNLPDPLIKDPSKYFDAKLWTGNGGEQIIGGGIRYSDYVTGTIDSANPATKAFDGITTNTGVRTATASNISITFQPPTPLAFSASFKIWCARDGTNAGNTFVVHHAGGSTDFTSSVTTGTTNTAVDLAQLSGVTSPISKIVVSSGGSNPRFTAIEVDGSMLIDSTADAYNFSPDLAWLKARSVAYSHQLYDTVRGVQKGLVSNTTAAEATYSNGLTAFNSDGFTIGSDGGINNNTSTFVGWAWDAGSSNTTISAGSLNSSVYNTSDRWSDDVAGATYGGAGMPVSRMFNGNLTQNVIANSGTSLTFSPSGFSSISSLRIYGSSYTRNANGIVINGTDYTSSFPQGGNSVAAWVTIPETSLTSVVWTTTSAGLENGSLFGIEVDGKLLVDDNQTPPNVPSITSTCRASQTNGLSISTYTGNGSAKQTLGHNLGAAPAFVIIKDRSTSQNWAVMHTSSPVVGTLDGGTEYQMLELSSSAAASNNSYDTIWHPTSTTVKIGEGATSAHWVNKSGDNYLMLAWAPVEGFSKFGSYVGNGSSDGPFIHTGFKVAWLLIKNTSTSNETWTIHDSTRDVDNPAEHRLLPNSSDAESTGTSARYKDLLSNGFKIRGGSGEQNTSGDNYIYAAFAEKPFIYARGA